MWRLLKLCSLSLVIYWAIFAVAVDRPLSLGILRLELLQKAARLAALPSPKLVILAGSNGPYSHSCVVLSAMLNMPCENAGIAVGIGLDDIFTRYAPWLRPGDVVYMPMELQQYAVTSRAYDASADDEFLLRHDRNILRQLPWPRIVGAGFCCNLGDFLEALVEMPVAARGIFRPPDILKHEYNKMGDRIDNQLADRDAALLPHAVRETPSARAIGAGYGTGLIAGFVARESAKGVVIIGGMPVDFVAAAMPRGLIPAIAAVYTAHGGMFTVLPNASRYPRADFFNAEDHLVKPCQYMHSVFVARRLAVILHKRLMPPPAFVLRLAADCPSA